jgi:uncharacterized protein (TIGR03382 family)
MNQLYVNDGLGLVIAESNGELYRPELPWSAAHYLDPDIPGSLRSEIVPTGLYMQAVWERIHQTWEESDLVIHTYPELPRRLLSGDSSDVSSWITVVFGRGVRVGSADFDLQDAEGSSVPFERRSTRWGGESDWSRLARVLPGTDLAAGQPYTLTMAAGVEMIGRDPLSAPWSFGFDVACEGSGVDCPPVEGAFVPDIGEPAPPDVVDVPDTGMPDAGTPDVSESDAQDDDAASDAAIDAGVDVDVDVDPGADSDVEVPESPDTSESADAGVEDAQTDVGTTAAGAGGDAGGCSAAASSTNQVPSPAWFVGALLTLASVRRRRRLS